MKIKNPFSNLFHKRSIAANKESPAKPIRFFLLDLHSAASADIIHIFKNLGHQVDYWTISAYSHYVFGKKNDDVEIINQATWGYLTPEMCDQFYERYRNYLEQFDAFIVTAFSSFSLIFEKLNKPIIIVNAVRYEVPFRDPKALRRLNRALINGVRDERFTLVANNLGDLHYLKYYTGLDSEFIPSLCEYISGKYSGRRSEYIFQKSRTGSFIKQIESSLRYTKLIKKEMNLYPSAQSIFNYKGVIHLPYQVSTMTIFEQYQAGVPLFFPVKQLLTELQHEHPAEILNEISYLTDFGRLPIPSTPAEPNNIKDADVIKFWIDSADFYDQENMPYIQYFDSFDHLKQLLKTVDTHEISRKMHEHNNKKKEMVYNKWRQILDKVTQKMVAQIEERPAPLSITNAL